MPTLHAGHFAASRDWAALKLAYETFEGADLTALAAANNITVRTLRSYASLRRWRRSGQPPVPRMAAATPIATESADGPTPVPAVTAAAVDELLARLLSIIALKLHQLEIRMSKRKPQSPADHEREARTIGNLVKQVEKVRELSRHAEGIAGNTGKSGGQGAVDDAERARRELKARIKSLREQPGE